MENEYSQTSEEHKQSEKIPKEHKKQDSEFFEIEGNINFTDIPKKKIIHGANAEQLTKMNFDKSLILEEILTKNFAGNYKLLFGEFQIAFICFLMGESLQAFEQWKNLFVLFSCCEDLVKKEKEMFLNIIRNIFYVIKFKENLIFFQPSFIINWRNSPKISSSTQFPGIISCELA